MSEKDIYLPEKATIVKIEDMTATEKYFHIRLDSGKPLGHKPGQFVEVSIFGFGEAPISVSSSPTQKDGFELVVRKVGNVTSEMHNLKVGAKIGIRGPFGTAFPTDEIKGKDILFIAGGIGLVPARSHINYVLDNRKDFGKVQILFGAKTPKERLFNKELDEWAKRKDVEFIETVDCGDECWLGDVGLITTLIPKVQFDPKNTYAIVVGPPIMYKFVIKDIKARGIPDEQIIVSLERRMKCGVGKCGHCQIDNYYCCQDGPVFAYSQIANTKEAI